MIRYKKVGTIAVGLLALVSISAFLGGSIGFLQGYAYGLGDTGVRSLMLTESLRKFRGGDINAGIASLESDLDSSIVTHWATRQGEPPYLSWIVRYMGMGKYDRAFLSKVARYRAEYPSAAPGQNVRETISSHLKTFETSGENSHQ